MPSQEVCAANAVTHYQGFQACVSSCTFIPEVEPNMMICAIKNDTDLANVKPGGDLGKRYTWCSVVQTFFAVLSLCSSTSFPAQMILTIQHRCDCSCDDLQPVERPSPIIMVGAISIHCWVYVYSLTSFQLLVQSLSFAAQSFVVILVGANLGLFPSFSQPMTIYSV
jgi:hypothetical protein